MTQAPSTIPHPRAEILPFTGAVPAVRPTRRRAHSRLPDGVADLRLIRLDRWAAENERREAMRAEITRNLARILAALARP